MCTTFDLRTHENNFLGCESEHVHISVLKSTMPKKSENTPTGRSKKADKNFTCKDEETALMLQGLSQNHVVLSFFLKLSENDLFFVVMSCYRQLLILWLNL